MSREIKLNEFSEFAATVEYPIDRETAVDRCADVTLVLADGRENLGDLLASSNEDRFGTADELQNEVMSLLPRSAVGEPYQSEGEG